MKSLMIRAAVAVIALLCVTVPAASQTLTVWPSPASPRADIDGVLTFELVVTNVGVTDAHHVRVVDHPLPGATLLDSTPAAVPTDDGGWMWALGDVAPGESARVRLSLDGDGTTGAVVSARGGAFRTARAPGVGVRTLDPAFDAYLAPTVDADADDPIVLAMVAAHAGDRDALVARVRDDIAFESYRGSLRGARGAWWSRAANATDQASLLIAALRASGVPARYALAEISEAQAIARVATMFSDPTRMSAPRRAPTDVVADLLALEETLPLLTESGALAGRTPEEALLDILFSDPLSDPTLIDESRDHAWVEYYDGAEWVGVDPTGPLTGSPSETRAELAEDVRHTVRIQLEAETYNPAFGIALGPAKRDVLDVAFASAALEGRPLTLAFDTVFTQAGGLVFGSTERNYTPELWVEGERVAVGDTFTELATSFPAATTIVFGATLKLTVNSPGEAPVEIIHRVADRYGAAARSGFAADLEVDTSQAVEGLSKLDAVTVSIASGDGPHFGAARYRARFAAAKALLEVEIPHLDDIAEATADGRLRDDDDLATVARAEAIGRDVNRDMGAFLAAHYEEHSAVVADATAVDTGVLAYTSSPRAIVVGVRSTDAGPSPRFDLARHELRVVTPPGVPTAAAVEFRTTRGLAEAELEGWALNVVAGAGEVVSFTTVVEAAYDQGIMLREIAAANVGDIASLSVSADAAASIQTAVLDGRRVLVPERAPEIAGQPALIWLELDPATGHVESVNEDGHHVALIQYATISNAILTEGFGILIGGLVGFSNGTLLGVAEVLNATLTKFSWGGAGTGAAKCIIGKNDYGGAAIGVYDDDIASLLMLLMKHATPDPGVAKFIDGFSFGSCLGTLIGYQRVKYLAGAAIDADPPLPAYDTGLIGPLRRPLSADHRVATSTVAPLALPATLPEPWTLSGTLDADVTALALSGDFTVSGEGELVDADGAPVSSGAFVATVHSGVFTGDASIAFDGRLAGEDGAWTASVLTAQGAMVGTLAFDGVVDDVAGRYEVAITDGALRGGPGELAATFVTASIADGVAHYAAGSAAGVDGTLAPGAVGPALTATSVLAFDAPPTARDVSHGARLTLPIALSSSDGAALEVWVEAPLGWEGSFDDDGAVVIDALEPAGADTQAVVWARAEDGRLAGFALDLDADAPATGLAIDAAHAPLYTTSVAGVPVATVVSIDVRNAGSEAVDATLTLDAGVGFDAQAGLEVFPLQPGQSGGTLVAIHPTGDLPAPGTVITLTATLETDDDDVSDVVSVPFPTVASAEIAFDPPLLTALPGETVETVLEVVGRGNAAGTLELLRAPSEFVAFTGIPDSVDVTPGETLRFDVTATLDANATLAFNHGTVVDAHVGEVLHGRAPLAIRASTTAGEKAAAVAHAARDIGEDDLAIAATLLGQLLERLESSCSENRMRELEFRLRNLSVAMTGDALAFLASDLWEEADAIAAASYSCDALDIVWICDTLEAVRAVLTEIDDALGEPLILTELRAPASVPNGTDARLEVVVEHQGDDTSALQMVTFTVRQGGAALAMVDVPVDPMAPGETATIGIDFDTSATLGSHSVTARGRRNARSAVFDVTTADGAPDGNRAPVFADAPPTPVIPREALSWAPNVSDPDGDAVFVSAAALPSGLRFVDGALEGTLRDEGTYTGVLVAQDRYGASAALAFEIVAAIPDGNRAPLVASLPPASALVDVPMSYTPSAFDPEGAAVTWAATELPDGASFDGTTLSWTPTIGDVGVHWVTLTLSDDRGATTTHRFAIQVRDAAIGADLVAVSVDTSAADLSGATRSGAATIVVANIGDTAAAATTATLYEDHDSVDGYGAGDTAIVTVDVPATAPGETVEISAALSGVQAFPGSLLRVHVDPDDGIVEVSETNNVGANVALDAGPHTYAAVRPTETDVVLLATAETPFRVIDPVSGDAVAEGTLEADMPTYLTLNVGDSDVAMPHFVVEAPTPVQVYVFEEIFAPNFGADLFHPALDGNRVGRAFTVFVPTLSSNNALVVTALERADVVLSDIDGVELESLALDAGTTWEPVGIAAGVPFRIDASGDLSVQSVSVTGASVVPPADAALAAAGDVGTTFRFSTRSRGAGGGAVAIFAYEDTEYEVLTSDGYALATGTLAAGEYAFQPGLGERRGALVRTTGDVSVLAGDIARAGAEVVGLMGEDLSQWRGVGGRDILAHSLTHELAASVVLAGRDGAQLDIDGVQTAIPPYGAHELEDDALVRIAATPSVVVQTMGGGDRYFDYGAVLRRIEAGAERARPVLANTVIDLTQCADEARASLRIGNAGGAAIPSGSTVSLVAVSPDGEQVVARDALQTPIDAGRWRDITLVGAPGPLNVGATWFVRLDGTGFDALVSAGDTPVGEALVCDNAPPMFVSTPPTSVRLGDELTYVAEAVDPEGGALRYTLLFAPTGATLRPDTGVLRWSPSLRGLASFGVQASDPLGEVAVQTFDVLASPTEACPDDLDGDDDGWCPPDDCDDTRADVRPGAVEVTGDGIDNDCDPTTTDVVSGAGLTLAVDTDNDTYAPGATVEVSATVGNTSALVGVEGLGIDVEIRCAGVAPVALDAAVPAIAPSATEEVSVTWDDTAGRYGACVAAVAVTESDTVLLQAFAPFSFASGLSATLDLTPTRVLRGEPFNVAWTLSNTSDSDISERVVVRAAGWASAFAEADVTLGVGGSTAGDADVDSSGLPPARYALSLRAGDETLATGAVDVFIRAETTSAFSEAAPDDDAWDTAQAAPIGFRPDGPNPGAAATGGHVTSAWTDDDVFVRVALVDASADDADRATLALSADGERVASVEWTRGAGGSGDGEVSAAVDGDETTLTWRVAADDLALANGRTLGARVETWDHDGDTLRDHWLWAMGTDDDATQDGRLVLFGRPGDVPVGPDAGVDADAGVDTGGDGFGGPDAGDDVGDAGVSPPSGGDSGCGCEVATPTPSGKLGFGLLALALALVRRRSAPRPRVGRHGALAAVALVAALLAACGDSHEPGEDATLEVGYDAPDVGGSDAPPFDAGDVPIADVFVPDVPIPDVGANPGAPTGTACDDDSECASGICQQGADYSVCTQLCDAYPCPSGFSCEPFPGGVSICVAVAICLDDDADDHGLGGACLGADCDDSNPNVNAGQAEVCNGIDDDCDGDIDEGVLNACGACGPVDDEVCNGVDDDCDGDVDEGVANACGTCGAPPEELCNEADDDCDGVEDEGACPECDPGDTRPCYGGPDDTEDVGICRGGVQRCEAGGWTGCIGQVLPEEELCDGIDQNCDGVEDDGVTNACGACGPPPVEACNEVDDDCDGDVDEGVTSACGGCTPCGSALVFPFEQGDLDPALAPAPDGGVTLGTGLLERHDIWVPNSTEDTVSRWDTRTGREVARYYVGEDPSRTAVDLNGNVWVGNRGDGTASHIFGNIADCIDRNDDGVIQTSRDLNGDGRITGGELLPEAIGDPLADECVHCQVRVGNANDLVRGVGVDADNFAWLGTYNSREVHKVDPETCEVVASLPTVNPETGTNATPVYGLAIDPNGDLWTSSYTDDCIVRVNTREARVVEQLCEPTTRYGIAVGIDGRVWYATYSDGLIMYDPALETWSRFISPLGLSATTGVVAANDGRVWTAGYNSHGLASFDPATETWDVVRTNAPPPGFASQTNPRGVTIDAEGHIWGICRGSSGLVEMTQEGDWIGSYRMVSSQNPSSGVSPYSYSDNTGFQLFNVVSSEGQWRHQIDLGVPVQLIALDVDAYTPEGTLVEVETRVAMSEAALGDASWSAPTEVRRIDLATLYPEPWRVLEIRARLATEDPETRPVLRDVRLLYETADCRLADFSCPAGQVCEAASGACSFVPRVCLADAACAAHEYCDDSGVCRAGCRLDDSTCDAGETCNAESRVCGIFTAECGTDRDCLSGSYCASNGYCTPGCRAAPDSCPPRFVCDAELRECEPLPPECALDGDCADDEYCAAGGVCLIGCRLGDAEACAEDELCDADTHACRPVPDDCTPADPAVEVCNGVDDDCNGVVDDGVTLGETCTVGAQWSGTMECAYGRPMCRADAPPLGETEVRQYASSIPRFSSQYAANNWSAARAAGPPDVGACSTSANSWASGSTSSDPDWIEARFAIPVRATGIRVFESAGGPFVQSIDLITVAGDTLEDMWTGTDETACGTWFEATWDETTEPIAGAVIHVQGDGYQYIDAVELVGMGTLSASLLAGTLDNVILPAGDHLPAGRISLTGNFVVESGATLGADDRGAWDLYRNSPGDTIIRGAAIRGAAAYRTGEGDVLISDTRWEAPATGPVTLDYRHSGRLDIHSSEFVDITVSTQGGVTSKVELSTFDALTDAAFAFLSVRGAVQLRDLALNGYNAVPRVSDGISVNSGADVDARGLTITRTETAIDMNSGGVIRLSDSVLSNADAAVYIRDNADVTFERVTFDLSDPGHTGVGVSAPTISPSTPLAFTDSVFDLAYGDVAFVVDPDVARDGVASGSTFPGRGPAGQYLVAGIANGPVSLGPFDAAVDWTLSGLVRLDVGESSIGALPLRSNTPGTVRTITARDGTTLVATSPELHDVLLDSDAGSTLTVEGGSVTFTGTSNQNMIYVEGEGHVNGTAFLSQADVAANQRRHNGVHFAGSATGSVSNATFVNLSYGVFVQDDATASVVGSAFNGCDVGVGLQERAVVAPLSQCAFVEDSAELLSVGVDVRVAEGGYTQASELSFDIGDEDIAISIDPDVFQVASPSTFADLTYVGGRGGQRVALRGQADTGELRVVGVDGGSVGVSETTTFRGGIDVTFAADAAIVAAANNARTFNIYDAETTATFEAGALVENVEIIVGTGATLAADGATFQATDSRSRDLLDVDGTATLTDCTIVGFERRQEGIRAEAAATVDTSGCTFLALNNATLSYTSGSFDVVGGEIDDCNYAFTPANAGQMSTSGVRVTGGYAGPIVVGRPYRPSDGFDFAMMNTTFDLGPDDVPLSIETTLLGPTRTLAVDGSTFVDGEVGRGYLVSGTATDLAISLAHLEPAQPSWGLTNTLTVNGTGALTIPDGTVIRREGTGVGIIDLRGEASADIDAATFQNTVVRFYNTASGTLDGAVFDMLLTNRQYLLQLFNESDVDVTDSVFSGVPEGNDNRGIYINGATLAPDLTRNTFNNLRTGIEGVSGPSPVLTDNVFNACVDDTTGLTP